MDRPRANAGVSPVVGTVMMLAIVIGVISVLFYVAIPQFRRFRAGGQADAGLRAIETLSERIKDVAFQRTVTQDEVVVDLPAGGLLADRSRTRLVVAWSSNGTARLNATAVNLTDGDAGYTLRIFGSEGLVPPVGSATDLEVRPVRWEQGQATTLATSATFDASGAPKDVNLTLEDRDGAAVPLSGGLFQLPVINASSGDVVGEVWVMDAAAVRFEGRLYTGVHRYEALHGAIVEDEPGRPLRVRGFEPFRWIEPAKDRLQLTLLRTTLPTDVPPSTGSGRAVVPLRSDPPFPLAEDRAVRNLTVDVLLNHTALLEGEIVAQDRFRRNATWDRVYVPGRVRLTATDHLVHLPEGLKPS